MRPDGRHWPTFKIYSHECLWQYVGRGLTEHASRTRRHVPVTLSLLVGPAPPSSQQLSSCSSSFLTFLLLSHHETILPFFRVHNSVNAITHSLFTSYSLPRFSHLTSMNANPHHPHHARSSKAPLTTLLPSFPIVIRLQYSDQNHFTLLPRKSRRQTRRGGKTNIQCHHSPCSRSSTGYRYLKLASPNPSQ